MPKRVQAKYEPGMPLVKRSQQQAAAKSTGQKRAGRPRKESAWKQGKLASGKPIEFQPVTIDSSAVGSIDSSAVGSIAELRELDGKFSLRDSSPPPLSKLLDIIEDDLRTALPNRKKMNSAGAWRASLFGFRCRQLMKQIHALRAQGADIEQAIALGILLGRFSVVVQVAEKEPDYVSGQKYREASQAGAASRRKRQPPPQELNQRLQALIDEGKKRTKANELLAKEYGVSPRTMRTWLAS